MGEVFFIDEIHAAKSRPLKKSFTAMEEQ